ncbi:hypothetical protein CI105_02205 [Candidatus Izimaplasma bacterium ZiA1]|uniref:hypothetical protein n=1 Tax=Candidatus Izimoplasma sp. ZiA1 TaxID=2024899 RepID=UPI000BAA8E53|nr:hypothetical protein CI105_02205 [Candidatus Izimaplasma bacterium ZiA1]
MKKFWKWLGKNRVDKSIFEPTDENHLYNAFLALMITGSLLLFQFAYYGIVAVVAWVLFAITSWYRGYKPQGTLLVAVVAIFMIVYQSNLIYTDILYQENIYVEDFDPRGGEYQDIYEVNLIMNNEDQIVLRAFQFAEDKTIVDEDWIPFEGDTVSSEGLGLRRDSYYLIIKIVNLSGQRYYYTSQFRYYITGN